MGKQNGSVIVNCQYPQTGNAGFRVFATGTTAEFEADDLILHAGEEDISVIGLNNNLAKKQATVTGGASTITSSNLSASRALISNSSGKVAVSSVTAAQLGYLSGARGNIQTQIDNKNSLKGKNGDNIIQFLWNADMTCTLYVDNTRIGNLNYTK